MKIFIIILICLVAVFVLAIAGISFRFALMVTHPKINSYKQQMDESVRLGRFTHEYIENFQMERFEVQSRYGYTLHGIIQDNEISRLPENRTKVAILCHGWTSGKISMSGYAKRLMDLGFTCLMYDHRNHGESAKCAPTSMGYYEKYDLQSVLDYCYERYGKDIRVITYGESMGSAIVLSLYLIDDRPAMTIADCGYSDIKELFGHLVRDWFHLGFVEAPIIFAADIWLRILGHFSMKQVRPIEGVEKTSSPILFCHGDSDTFISCSMSEDMSKVGPGVRELYLCPGADHAVSEVTCPEEYGKVVKEFIGKYYR